jgi:sigma-B regulation protein RsbU (phosphoserine phosphatase)
MNNYKHRILIVDDEPTNLQLMRQLLAGKYQLSFASNGIEAIELALAVKPDIILLDIMMPEMDGYETCRQLKSNPQTANIPVIFATAMGEEEDESRGFEVGGVDYITKPVKLQILKARVETHLRLRHINLKLMDEVKVRKQVQERLQGELKEASNYVKALLPAPASDNQFSVDWRFLPSSELGGDSFGYHWIDDDHFAIYLVDVAGHGVGAALLSVSVINYLRSHALPNTDFREPQQVLNALNVVFQAEKQNDMFFTIWYGVYNKKKKKIVYSSGGHPPALILSASEGKKIEIQQLITPNISIGALPDYQFQQRQHELTETSRLYVFSDGVYEITKENGQIWKFEEFLDFLLTISNQNSSCLDHLVHHAKELNPNPEFEDDYTIIEITFS